jgi:hypothetical protein
MQVTIGGVAVDISSSGIDTLGDLIDAVHHAVAEKNEVVIRMTLNGEPISPEAEVAVRERSLETDDDVAFEVQDASAVLVAALEQTRDGLPALEGKLEQVATALQCGSRQEAFTIFSECLSHWRQVIQLLQVSQMCIGYDPEQVEIEGRSIRAMNDELLAALQETKQAMEQGDLVALSDLLEYELIKRIQQERVLLDVLIGMVPMAE